MKNIKYLICFIICISLFSSCKKENLGLFSPQKKINNIHKKTGSRDVLLQDWTWNSGLLTKIDYYQSNGNNVDYTNEYKYNGTKISEISNKLDKLKFYYDNDNLSKIEYYYGDIYQESYVFEYEKGVLNKISVEVDNAMNQLKQNTLSPLRKMNLHKDFAYYLAHNQQKGMITAEIKLKWDNNNIIRADIEFPGDKNATITYNYSYDKNKSPFSGLFTDDVYGIFNQYSFNGSLEKNNLMSAHRTVFNANLDKYQTESWTFDYEYKNKFPISIDESYTDYLGRITTGSSYTINYY